MKRATYKLIPLVLAVIILFTTTTVYAATWPEIDLCYEGLARSAVTLDISDTGLAQCTAKATLSSGYSANVTATLQQSTDRVSWDSIKEWSGSGTRIVTAQGIYYVLSGYYYRLKVTIELYNSNSELVDTVPAYSTTKYY